MIYFEHRPQPPLAREQSLRRTSTCRGPLIPWSTVAKRPISFVDISAAVCFFPRRMVAVRVQLRLHHRRVHLFPRWEPAKRPASFRRHHRRAILFPRKVPATTLLLRSHDLVAVVDCYHVILHHLERFMTFLSSKTWTILLQTWNTPLQCNTT